MIRYSAVLVLLSTLVSGQSYDLDAQARSLFDDVLPHFRKAESGEVEVSQARLEWLYDGLLRFRAHHEEHWPAAHDFEELTDSIHAFAEREEFDLTPLARSDWNHSIAFEDRGAFQVVEALFERNLVRYDCSEPHRPLFLYTLGHYDRLCGRWESALSRLAEAASAIVDVAGGELAELAAVLVDLERCAVSIELGLFEDAIPAVERARHLAQVMRSPALWLDAAAEEANLANAMGDYDRLARLMTTSEGDPLFEELGEPARARLLLRYAIGRIDHERTFPDEPRDARWLLEDLITSGELREHDLRLARTWLADLLLEEGALELAADQLALLREVAGEESGAWCGGLPDRLQVARVALDGRLALARRDSPDELRRRLVEVRGAVAAMRSRHEATRVRQRGLAVLYARLRMQLTESLVALTLAVHGEDGPAMALEELARSQGLGSLARAMGATPATEPELRASLAPPGGGLVAFLPGATKTIAFAVDEAGTRLFDLPPIYRIDPVRRRLVRSIGRVVQDDVGSSGLARVQEDAAALKRVLFSQELSEHVEPWEDVVFVGVDSIGYVPFELLPWNGRRLGATKAVSYLPSLPVGNWLAQRPKAPASRRSVTVFAAPDAPVAGDVVTPVPFGDPERRRLLERCALQTRVLHGASATLASLRELDTAQDLILQVVAHGVRTEAVHSPFGLLLAGGASGVARVLTPTLAEDLDVPPVVALTACGAWRGPYRRGDDGRAHLAGSLFVAGAGTLVVSYLPIDYASSLRTMGKTYDGLTRQGLSPARALQVARADSEDGDLTPFLIHVVGNANEPLLPPKEESSSALRFGLVAALGLAGIAAVWAVRNRRHAS